MEPWYGLEAADLDIMGEYAALVEDPVLREWRGLRPAGRVREASDRLPYLLLTVNGIASGLGTTG